MAVPEVMDRKVFAILISKLCCLSRSCPNAEGRRLIWSEVHSGFWFDEYSTWVTWFTAVKNLPHRQTVYRPNYQKRYSCKSNVINVDHQLVVQVIEAVIVGFCRHDKNDKSAINFSVLSREFQKALFYDHLSFINYIF